MEKYTKQERIDYIGYKIDFLVEQEPSLLSVIERMIEGLIIVNYELINNTDKMAILSNVRCIKNKKAISFLKDLSYIYSVEDLKKNKN